MNEPNLYTMADLIALTSIGGLMAYLLGRIHAENAARRYNQRRDAARRRHAARLDHPTNNPRKGNPNQ